MIGYKHRKVINKKYMDNIEMYRGRYAMEKEEQEEEAYGRAMVFGLFALVAMMVMEYVPVIMK